MRAPILFAVLWFWIAGLANSANLYFDQAMYKVQTLYSDDGRYVLIMQHDGNLVYYRTTDWVAIWSTDTQNRGNIAVMQGDGNFVVYDTSWNAVWHTSTHGHPGAFIAAQGDGNLVIYQKGQALWHKGADHSSAQDPTDQADVVGRNMENNMPYSSLGHIGLYDGKGGVYEVLNDDRPNAVAFNTLEDFKRRANNGYWGGAFAKIPHFYGFGCFNDYCGDSGYQLVPVRWGMVLRAFQILTIGAKYTYFAQSISAMPRTPNSRVREGLYRCDTFVLDMYKLTYVNPANAAGYPMSSSAPEYAAATRWLAFVSGYLQSVMTPRSIFDKIKNYAG